MHGPVVQLQQHGEHLYNLFLRFGLSIHISIKLCGDDLSVFEFLAFFLEFLEFYSETHGN